MNFRFSSLDSVSSFHDGRYTKDTYLGFVTPTIDLSLPWIEFRSAYEFCLNDNFCAHCIEHTLVSAPSMSKILTSLEEDNQPNVHRL